ncbi:MAG: outer membrane protein assembly factor BamB [Methylococcaceae bacterium]|nr:outer membrane protein assembly factor BamB [Methylococcaceae bacterium]
MRYPILMLCAALLSGCAGLDVIKDGWDSIGEMISGKDNAEPPKELQELEPKLKLSVLWDATVGDGYAEQHVNLVPAVTEESVFAVDRKGLLQAHNRLNGEKRWAVETELPFSAGPVVGREMIVLGTSNAEVVAYSQTDGSLRWKSSVSSEILATPAVGSGVVVVRGSDGRITGLDEKSGATLWTHERSAPTLAVRSKGGPIIAGDLLIDGYGSGKLIAMNLKNGKQEWEATVAIARGRSEIERLVDLDAVPVIKGDTLYVSGYQGGVAAVSLRDGDVQWREEKVSTHSGLAANRRSLFLADQNSDVWRLDMSNGGDLWKQDGLHQRRLTAPAAVKDKLVIGDFEGYLHVLSQDDGGLLARARVDDSPIEAPPVVFDEVVYVYTSGGKLAALSLE